MLVIIPDTNTASEITRSNVCACAILVAVAAVWIVMIAKPSGTDMTDILGATGVLVVVDLQLRLRQAQQRGERGSDSYSLSVLHRAEFVLSISVSDYPRSFTPSLTSFCVFFRSLWLSSVALRRPLELFRSHSNSFLRDQGDRLLYLPRYSLNHPYENLALT